MFASTVRNAARATPRQSRRAISTQSRLLSTTPSTSEENPSSSSLSPRQTYMNAERKRELISLYHQAETFVTHENLSDYIDSQFTQNFSREREMERREDGKSDLMLVLAESRARPKMVTSSAAQRENLLWRPEKYTTMSLKRKSEAKEKRVRAAVYGVDESFKASLEMVEERERSTPDEKEQET